MCGINGIVFLNEILDAEKRIGKMNCALAHRGPDADGFDEVVSGRVVFGQRRLSILDLDSRSNQPMWSDSKASVIVFNGEIYNYQSLKNIREPYTFFKNIYQLPAGCCLKLDRKFNTEIIRYWDIPEEFNMEKSYDENAIYSSFKKEVIAAIQRRMIADVPLGTYLSGGIDSSIISAVCSINSVEPVNTYTIGFPELNEFRYAREVADQYGTVHHEILIKSTDYFDKLEEIISYKDAPLGVPNEIPLAIMSKELKRTLTVVLSGEGADELMGGYGRIYRAPFDYSHFDANYEKCFYDYFIGKYEYVPREVRDKYLKVPHSIRDEHDAVIRNEFERHENEQNVFQFFHRYHVKGLVPLNEWIGHF